MKDHALPQDVTGYKFHIIGNMTLKQFAEVAAGVGIGFIFYFTNLPALIKWPLILIFSGAGALAAFVPFEERPLDHWILSLVRALYRPTQFYWKRLSKIPEPLLYEPKTELHSMVKEVDLTPARRQRVKEYLHSVGTVEEIDSIEQYSNQRLSDVMTIFDQTVYRTQPDVQNQLNQTVVPEKMVLESPQPQPTQPAKSMIIQPVESFKRFEEQASKITLKQDVLPISSNSSKPIVMSQEFLSNDVDVQTTINTNKTFTKEAVEVAASLVNQGVAIPETHNIKIDKQAIIFEPRTAPQLANQAGDTYITSQTLNTSAGLQPTQTAIQDKSLPFPTKPTQPNKLVGMTLDLSGAPLQNVIIEILTQEGIPARAVKTNILGQFFITTPLNNGIYTISAEKEGYTFPPQRLELTGQVINPIEVRSK